MRVISLLLLKPQRALSWSSVSSKPYSSEKVKLKVKDCTHLKLVLGGNGLGEGVSGGSVSSTPLCPSVNFSTSLQGSTIVSVSWSKSSVSSSSLES